MRLIHRFVVPAMQGIKRDDLHYINNTDSYREVRVYEGQRGKRKFSDYKNSTISRDGRREIIKAWLLNPETKMVLRGLKKDPEALKGWLHHAAIRDMGEIWAVGEYCKAPREVIEEAIASRKVG